MAKVETEYPAVLRHADGTWYCRPYLGKSSITGKPLRPYKRLAGATSEEEAREQARAWLAPLLEGSLEGYLFAFCDVVEDMGATKTKRPRANTARSYRSRAKVISRVLPGVSAKSLSPADVTRAYRQLLDKDGEYRLSAASVAAIHWFLCSAYKWMVAQGLVDTSPMPSVAHPSAARTSENATHALSVAESSRLKAFLEQELACEVSLRTETCFAARISLVTGLRVGEVLALRRQDVRAYVPDLYVCGTVVEAGGLHRQDKTKNGRGRAVAITQEDVALIERHMAVQGELAASAPLVTVDGGWLRPSAVSRMFRRIAVGELGLPSWMRYHSLRHNHATMLLLAGADMRSVQSRMDHASAATTIDLYGHVLPGRDAELAQIAARTLANS